MNIILIYFSIISIIGFTVFLFFLYLAIFLFFIFSSQQIGSRISNMPGSTVQATGDELRGMFFFSSVFAAFKDFADMETLFVKHLPLFLSNKAHKRLRKKYNKLILMSLRGELIRKN